MTKESPIIYVGEVQSSEEYQETIKEVEEKIKKYIVPDIENIESYRKRTLVSFKNENITPEKILNLKT